MQKGKYGICLWFYAVLGFILAFLGQTLLCMLLLGFVIVAEKNDWLTKQVMQALFLSLFSGIANLIFNSIHSFWNSTFYFSTTVGVLTGVLSALVGLLVLIFVIIGIIISVKGSPAGIPIFSKLANRAFGLIERKVVYHQPPQQPPYPPTQGYQPSAQQPPQQPFTPQDQNRPG